MVLYLLGPVLPYVEYAINKDYIAKNLCVQKNIPNNCCQGRCYLHERLARSSDPIDNSTDHNKRNIQNKKVEDHLKSDGIFASLFVKDISVSGYYYQPHLIDIYISPVFVPPQL
jgi:hypothetical protein